MVRRATENHETVIHCAGKATSESERESDAAEQELKREYHRAQFAAIGIVLAPCDFTHGGLIEAEIEQG